jgi:hypothetical protein
MNVNMPGFTAEASLYQKNGRYYRIGTRYEQVGNGEMLPQRVNLRNFGLVPAPRTSEEFLDSFGFGETYPVRPGSSETDGCWYGNWCGPLCGGGDPVDDLDSCCKAHDECYAQNGYLNCSCDWDLANCAADKINFWSDKGWAALAIFNYFINPAHPCNPVRL